MNHKLEFLSPEQLVYIIALMSQFHGNFEKGAPGEVGQMLNIIGKQAVDYVVENELTEQEVGLI